MSRLKTSRRSLPGGLLPVRVMASCLLLFSLPSSGTFSYTARQQSSDELTVAKVLANVRRAVGYDKLRRLKQGFVLEEAAQDAPRGEARRLMLGSRGQYREETVPSNNRPLGFDGRFGWQIGRTGLREPLPQRLREKILIPAWVRSGWWLNERAPLRFALLPAETDDKQVALSMRLERGLVGAKIFIDRATWLPMVLIVEYERGPYTVRFKDYQETLGFRFPQRLTVNYRGSDSEYEVKTITEIVGAASRQFEVPPLPPDTTFDNKLPAELRVAQGVPFSADSPGHYYVRPLIDGRDIGWFHFDTGGDAMHIDARLADELKMPVLGRSQTRGADGRVQEVTIRQGKLFSWAASPSKILFIWRWICLTVTPRPESGAQAS